MNFLIAIPVTLGFEWQCACDESVFSWISVLFRPISGALGI